MNPLKALLASMLLVAAAALAACGNGSGNGSTTGPGLETQGLGQTQETLPASSSGLSST
jgi:hypothetical protein